MATMPDSAANDNDSRLAPIDTLIDRVQRTLKRAVDALVGVEASFCERERAMLEISNEASRRNLQRELQAIADSHSSEYLLVDKKLYKRHQEGSALYHSLCGSMKITRPTYRRSGGHNGQIVVPTEKQAGLIARATPALAYCVALGDAQCPGRHWQQLLSAAQHKLPSRSTLERMAKRIGTDAKTASASIEPLVRSVEQLPEGARAISMGLDRTTIPMQEPIPAHFSTAVDIRKRRKKPYERRPPEPFEVNYRMGYVGTVTFTDEHGEGLCTLRYAASADEGPARVVDSMMADLRHAQKCRSRQGEQPLVVGIVQDAAPELWALLEQTLRAEPSASSWHCAIDRYHLMEHLGQALTALPMQVLDTERTLARWRLQLDQDDDAIDRIAAWLRNRTRRYEAQCRASHRSVRLGEYRTLVDTLNYIRNHRDKMRYRTLRDACLPTGSGATEGACKSLVMIRTKRCGQRWSSKGVNAVLTLRAYYMSERLPAFWKVFASTYRANVIQAA